MYGMKTDKQYMAEDDLRTLVRAKEIHMDKKRYKAAMAEAKKQESALDEITGGDDKPTPKKKPMSRNSGTVHNY